MRFEDFKFRTETNYQFLEWLEKEKCDNYEWMVTVIFYTALHRLRAVLARDHNANKQKLYHHELIRLVNQHYSQISVDYTHLYTECRSIRYWLLNQYRTPEQLYIDCKNKMINIFNEAQI